MRVCDRHPERRAEDTLILKREDSHIDICSECKTDILTLINAPIAEAKRRGRPPKDLAQAN